MGAKVVLASESGQRESKESWTRVLRDRFARGLRPWQASEADCPKPSGIRAAAPSIYHPLWETLPQSRDAEPLLRAAGDLLSLSERSLDPLAHRQSGGIAVRGGALRTDDARRYKKVASAEALIWKILMVAEKKFRRLNSSELFEQV